MEREWWLIALIALIALGGPVLLLVAVGVVGLGLDGDPQLVRTMPRLEVSVDPGRAIAGVGVAILLVAAAGWVISRTDWSSSED